MGQAICAECGNGFHWYSGRGCSVSDVLSPCHRAPAAKGKIIEVSHNNLRDEWATHRMKVFVINGHLRFAAYSGCFEQAKADDSSIWFTQAGVEPFGAQQHVFYWRIARSELERIGYRVAQTSGEDREQGQ